MKRMLIPNNNHWIIHPIPTALHSCRSTTIKNIKSGYLGKKKRRRNGFFWKQNAHQQCVFPPFSFSLFPRSFLSFIVSIFILSDVEAARKRSISITSAAGCRRINVTVNSMVQSKLPMEPLRNISKNPLLLPALVSVAKNHPPRHWPEMMTEDSGIKRGNLPASHGTIPKNHRCLHSPPIPVKNTELAKNRYRIHQESLGIGKQGKESESNIKGKEVSLTKRNITEYEISGEGGRKEGNKLIDW